MATIVLGDIVTNIKEVVNPKTCGLDKFVGLEHYDAGEPMITRYGTPENLDTNVKHFYKGDILVARRNVYLKRAGYVDFEGVTSGDSIVLRVTNPAYQRILPFILNTDDFWDYAEQNADGTMSKRLSPDDLLDYEFEEPEGKDILAEKLWAAYLLKESYRQLLATTDDMLKAKFQEMFSEGDYPVKELKDVCLKLFAGGDKPDDICLEQTEVYKYPVYSNGEGDRGLMGYSKTYKVEEDAITISARGLVGYTAIRDGKFTPVVRLITIVPTGELCLHYLKFYLDTIDFGVTGGAQKQLTIPSIVKELIMVPPIELQRKFEDMFIQTEATQSSLRQSIESISRVMHSLINQ